MDKIEVYLRVFHFRRDFEHFRYALSHVFLSRCLSHQTGANKLTTLLRRLVLVFFSMACFDLMFMIHVFLSSYLFLFFPLRWNEHLLFGIDFVYDFLLWLKII